MSIFQYDHIMCLFDEFVEKNKDELEYLRRAHYECMDPEESADIAVRKSRNRQDLKDFKEAICVQLKYGLSQIEIGTHDKEHVRDLYVSAITHLQNM